ncbi:MULTISPECIES: SDR family oxidoreductase [unclassified Actinopolyspora]|uniref:SDR family oxidoreductase n=1 Tax=unclassified Actinopolyspora TaxID=2639451 RepID=UPI0013F5AAF0|nr:SDR family oxidoreductase [Actinopolyspora sp. BKK2]NHE78471.1 SDR family oxidoreductase [Actinopolyspora sp. BKK1]
MIDPQLDGQVVLVTGGAGGIGAAIAEAFSTQGARLAVHYLAGEPPAPAGTQWQHQTPTAESAERFARGLPSTAITVEADLSDSAAITQLLDDVEDRLGPVDVLVNNAAHCESPDTVDDLTGDGLQRHYRVNAIAPAVLTSELARRRRGTPACVVNISTDAAGTFPGQIGYGTSKAAVEALTRATALDLAPVNIRVNAIAPGPIQTGWLADEHLDHVTSVVPLGRVGYPDDVADAALFLASHQARWITGQVLQVAGGHAL